jgi:hypothetical protein
LAGIARTNPYETPRSTLHQLERMLERRRIVKLYLGLAALVLAARVLAASQPAADLLDLAGVAALGISLLALFGYAYRRPLGRAWLWKVWLPVALLGAAAVDLTLPLTAFPRFAFPVRAYLYVFDALLCAALYLYAFRSPDVWRSAS